MSNLGPQNINLSYEGLLQAPGGLTSTPQAVTDGLGILSDLFIATSGSSVTNLNGGLAGSIPYQSAVGITSFLTPGTPGQVLLSNGVGGIYWGTGIPSSIANALAGGVAGSVPYQTSSGATSFVTVGSVGQILQSNGSGAPVWVNSNTLNANSAVNLAAGSINAIPYQSLYGTTSFLAAASTVGSLLQSNGVGSSPSWATNITLPIYGQVNFTPTSQPAAANAGDFYYDVGFNQFRGYNGTQWGSIGQAAQGANGDQIFFENGQTVTASYTITSNFNAGTFGPISISSVATVTVPDGSIWTVV